MQVIWNLNTTILCRDYSVKLYRQPVLLPYVGASSDCSVGEIDLLLCGGQTQMDD